MRRFWMRESPQKLGEALESIGDFDIVCVGTNILNGDAVGPAVGSNLFLEGIEVHGTMSRPIHANNLIEFVSTHTFTRPVVAVDAMLGSLDKIGSIVLNNKPLKPGTGVDKALPTIGNYTIGGVIAPRGVSPILGLADTPLPFVFEVAKWISTGILIAKSKVRSGTIV